LIINFDLNGIFIEIHMQASMIAVILGW